MAEHVLGSVARGPLSFGSPAFENLSQNSDNTDVSPSMTQHVNRIDHDREATIGTPIRLAPSNVAFKKNAGSPQKSTSGSQTMNMTSVKPSSPAKGIVGQVSDLIFGW